MIDPAAPVAIGELEVLRENLGLNQPFFVRYGIWVSEAQKGNMGYSFVRSVPVMQRIQERLGPTLILTISSLLISVVIGIPLGLISALRQYSRVDYVLTLFAFAGISVPNFILALAGIFIFALKLDVLPTSSPRARGNAHRADTNCHCCLCATDNDSRSAQSQYAGHQRTTE